MSCAGCETQISNYHSDNLYTWCTNCGNYGIAAATKRALVAEGVTPRDAMLVYDVGCNGNGADKIGGYRFHGLHGRALPFACGAAIANPKLTTIASAGDGAALSEGISHLVHAIRNNYNLTYIIHNNSNYALTTGQASAATRQDVPMNTSPDGVTADTLNIMELVLALNPSFAARTFSGDVQQMTALIREGIKHKGLSIIEVLQYCPTYNKVTPHEWYQERVFDTITLEDYDNTDINQAKQISVDLNEKIATGILYHQPEKPDYMARQANRTDSTTSLVEEVKSYSIENLVNKFV